MKTSMTHNKYLSFLFLEGNDSHCTKQRISQVSNMMGSSKRPNKYNHYINRFAKKIVFSITEKFKTTIF